MKMKKIKIIPCDEKVIAQIPNIIGFLEYLFGDKEIRLYATLEDNELGFVGETDEFSVLIDNEGNYTVFTIGEDGKLYSIYKDNYSVFFKDDELSHIIDNDRIEYSLSFCPLKQLDKDGYDGNVSFKQYNPENDVLCEIYYQHMCREINGSMYIFEEHTKRISELYIDEDYNKNIDVDYSETPRFKPRILPKRAKYFVGYTFGDRNPGFTIAAIKDFGILKVLKEGAISLFDYYKVVRYAKAFALLPNGEFFNNWPLSKQYKEEDLKSLIKGYGLKSELPKFFMDLYNDENEDVTRIKQIIMDINELKEREEPPTTNMWLKLKKF